MVLTVKLPYWVIKYSLFPKTRSRQSWTLMQQMLVETLRWTMGVVAHFNFTFARNIDLPSIPSTQLAFSHTVTLPPLDIAELKGFIRESADDVGGLGPSNAKEQGVRPRPIPAYWFIGKKRDKNEELQPLSETDDDPILLFFHGGAYKFGSSHEDDATSIIAKEMVDRTPIKRVLSVDYRLAGRAPFPAALIDALAGYAYLVRDCKIPPSRIIVGGDSAGGNLTLALTRYLRDEGALPMPAALILLSPWVDMTKSHWQKGSSLFMNKYSDYITGALGDAAIAQFTKGHSSLLVQSPYLSPGSRFNIDSKSFTGFPQTYCTAGEAEMIRDEIRFLVNRMRDTLGEAAVTYSETPDAPHDVFVWKHWGHTREEAIDQLAHWLEKRFPVAAEAKRKSRLQTTDGKHKKSYMQ